MSRRRFLLAVAAATTLTLSACSQAVPTKISVSQAQLEQGLLQQFPKRFPVAGLLQLEMQRPALQLLPASNQLQTHLPVQLSGPALRQSYAGRMEVRFALRYEPQDRTVRAHRVEVLSLQFDGTDPAVADMVSTYGPRLASQALEAFALYHVKPEELQLADSLGLQPGAITVTPQGLDVAIVAKDAAAKP
ncbi:DUF1439 domain-containing protein [Comamonas aquatica]|uniref:DUF1439 domain-containing protein n=1 Tax=Comamonas aquatica TaxID=225991 RepID=UPI002446F978|nr:DUF1439 domain-containing protein [Comamonas aquatica]MDH0370947.1 DUF1439 domain-containing protein [Comamonas aquatica]